MTVSSKNLVFVSEADQEGLFYWLGINGGSQAFVAPIVGSGVDIEVITSVSQSLSGSGDSLIDRASAEWHSGNTLGSWAEFELGGASKIKVNHISVRNRTASTHNSLKNFDINVSVDGITWVAVASNSSTFAMGSWKEFVVSVDEAIKYIRIIGGTNSTGGKYLVFSEMEVYGDFYLDGLPPPPLSINGTLTETHACQDFRAIAYSNSGGEKLSESPVVNNVWSLGAADDSPLMVMIKANMGDVRKNSVIYSVGDLMFSVTPKLVPYYYRCTQGGVSAVSEPVLPQFIGGTVSDGGAAWVCVEGLIQTTVQGPLIPS